MDTVLLAAAAVNILLTCVVAGYVLGLAQAFRK